MATSTTTHVLVTYCDNWAEEYDVSGFQILANAEWEEFVVFVNAEKFEYEFYFGANESILYKNAAQLLDTLFAKPITETEAKTIGRLLGYIYGDFPRPITFPK